MKKLKMTAVSYLNAKPFMFGLQEKGLDKEIDIQIDYPAKCAEKLVNGEVDIALVPVAILPELGDYHLIGDYCIGCDGAVKTVCIFSHKPLAELKQIYLDFHSRTSSALAKILIDEYWKLEIPLINMNISIENDFEEDTGIVAIGDKTIALSEKYKYCYDLGEHWKTHTDLPFVFAAWVSKNPIQSVLLQKLQDAFAYGIANLESVIKLLPEQNSKFDLKTYFEKYIAYDLDELKLQALSLFLSKIRTNENSKSKRILIH